MKLVIMPADAPRLSKPLTHCYIVKPHGAQLYGHPVCGTVKKRLIVKPYTQKIDKYPMYATCPACDKALQPDRTKEKERQAEQRRKERQPLIDTIGELDPSVFRLSSDN